MSVVPFVPTGWNEGAAPGISAAELNRLEVAIAALADGTWTGGAFLLGPAGEILVREQSGNYDVIRSGDAASFRQRISASHIFRRPDDSVCLQMDAAGNVSVANLAGLTVGVWNESGSRWSFTPNGVNELLRVGAGDVRLIGSPTPQTGGEVGTVRNVWASDAIPAGSEGVNGDVWIVHGGGGVFVKVGGAWISAAGNEAVSFAALALDTPQANPSFPFTVPWDITVDAGTNTDLLSARVGTNDIRLVVPVGFVAIVSLDVSVTVNVPSGASTGVLGIRRDLSDVRKVWIPASDLGANNTAQAFFRESISAGTYDYSARLESWTAGTDVLGDRTFDQFQATAYLIPA